MLFTVLRGWGFRAIWEVILAEVVGCFWIVDNQKLLNVAVKIVLIVNFLSE
jgi:hypothetical protein